MKPIHGERKCILPLEPVKGVQKQYLSIVSETRKLRQMFNGVYSKFLQAIDHMEYHPTLGKEKKGSSVRLQKRSMGQVSPSLTQQLKYLSRDDIEMLQQGNEVLQKQFLKNNETRHRQKRFGLVSWILGWGVYSNAHNIMTIKCNIQALYDQNILQEKQIIELTHYLNVTYGHVQVNRYAINELNIKVAMLNKTLMMVIGETKFVKFTVAVMTDMRMTLARLTMGITSLQENVNAIYEYMQVLATRKVNPLIIPPDALRQILVQAKEDMKLNPRRTFQRILT